MSLRLAIAEALHLDQLVFTGPQSPAGRAWAEDRHKQVWPANDAAWRAYWHNRIASVDLALRRADVALAVLDNIDGFGMGVVRLATDIVAGD